MELDYNELPDIRPGGDTHAELADMLRLLMAASKKISEHRLDDYKPYLFQERFHNCLDLNGYPAHQKFLQAGNQTGKTYSAAEEVAMHVTGEYPIWYTGIRLKNPRKGQVSGVTNETTRDICQAELLGDPEDPEAFGTGTIPKNSILATFRKPGIQNAFDSVQVRHKNGHKVTIKFRAYEAGKSKFMGHSNDFCWCDEEPPSDIWSQVNRSQIARPDSIILVTFTPEEGNTQLVIQLAEELAPGQGFVNATWDDAPHINDVPGRKEYLLSFFPIHEREMRSRGIPMVGSGLIFPIKDEEIMIEPREIPTHWKRINGLDFGWTHPFAVAFCAYDEQEDIIYLTAEYSQSNALPPMVASAIKAKGPWIPCVWPHDGMSMDDKGKDKSKRSLLEDEGVNMHDTWFTNPPAIGEKEGSGGNSVETGLMNMLTRMETGRLKVFSTCDNFFKEKSQYHRKMKSGKSEIQKINDDVISAFRYACQSLRHSRTELIMIPQRSQRVGARNWG